MGEIERKLHPKEVLPILGHDRLKVPTHVRMSSIRYPKEGKHTVFFQVKQRWMSNLFLKGRKIGKI